MKKISILVVHDPGPQKDKGPDKPDVVVEQITAALTGRGHSVDRLAIPSDVEAFVAGVRARRPDLIFNLAESFGDNMYQDVNVAAVLELMGVPFTGSDVGGLFMAQDKVLTKKLLAFHGVKYPEYLTFSAAHIETGGNVRFPLFVKPQRADSSLGIHAASLVQDYKSLIERVAYVHETFGGAALAEEYIEGREYYLSVIGGLDPQVLSVVELDFSGLPQGAVHVASYDAKWKARTKAYKGTKSVIAREISDELRSRLKKVAREAYLALRLRDYGRVDVRVTEAGEIYVIEVNPNPYLERSSEVAMSAADAGVGYDDLIERIVEMAWKRRRELKAGTLNPAAFNASARAAAPAAKNGDKVAEKVDRPVVEVRPPEAADEAPRPVEKG